MSIYTFERLHVLLVEDNTYVRNVFRDLLHSFRFGRISVAKNGQDAIEHLKIIKESSGPAGQLDLIISDMFMSPINGMLLLRWVRTAKESPNRFMPFIMLSGAADHEYVKACRDLGLTEFLAKPFSVSSVYKRILEVIDYPRQFVTTQEYFGPDRRRQNLGGEHKERRVTQDADVTIVYSSDRVVKPKNPTEVWYFRLPNTLRDRVGGLGGGEGGEIPDDILEEAEGQLQRAQLDFTEWAMNYTKNLAKLAAEAASKDKPYRHKYFEQINLLAHELRGQGGTFGYPLISRFGKMLYEATREGCRVDDSGVEIVKAHVDAMRAVLRDKVSGDGGDVGRALIQSLKHAIENKTLVE